MQSILIIGFFEAFFLVALLLTKRRKQQHDYILACYLFINGLTILGSFFDVYNRTHNFPYPALLNLDIPFIFLHGPLLWFYVKALSVKDLKFKPIYILHFLPFFLIIVEHWTNIYSLPENLKIWINATESFKSWPIYPVVVAAIAISIISYQVWCFFLIKKYNKKVRNYFSQDEKINLNWLKTLLICTFLCYMLAIIIFDLDLVFHYAKYGNLQSVTYIFASIFILFLGFYGHKQGNIFTSSQIEPEFSNGSEFTINKKVTSDDEQFISALTELMKGKKPFLDSELTIASLSKSMNVSPYYMSGILNDKLNLNFYDFVNYYRVEEFKLKLTEPQNAKLSFEGIAYDCGFSSKATFYRVFKKNTGLSPSEFQKKTIDSSLV
jgi:AraC-like DNA-binding protein